MSAPKPERVRQILKDFAEGRSTTILQILDPSKFTAEKFQHLYGYDVYTCAYGWPCIFGYKSTLVHTVQHLGGHRRKYHADTCDLLPYLLLEGGEDAGWTSFSEKGLRQAKENLLYYIDPIYHQLYLQILDEIELKKL